MAAGEGVLEYNGLVAGYRVIRLTNGVRVALVPVAGARSVTVEVFVKIGSRYEKKGEYGMSHFLEHMAFKGTKKRPRAGDIHREIDARGAVHDAGTGCEATNYYIKTVPENVDWALELLSDILACPRLDDEEVAKERSVIIEEIKMYDDNPVMGMTFDFMDFVFKDTGIGCFNIAGRVEDVGIIDRKGLLGYRKKYLDGRRMVVVMAGAVTGLIAREREVTRKLERCFGVFGQSKEELPKAEMVFGNKKKMRKKREIEQAHFCLGVPGVGRQDERRYAMKLVEIMLAGNSSSRLFEELRQKRALAYYVFSVGEVFEEVGFVAVQAGVAKENLDLALELTKKVFLDFGKTVKGEELVRAKSYLLGKTKIGSEQTDFWSDLVGQGLLFDNKAVTLSVELGKYQSVVLEDIVKIADELFTEAEVRVSRLTP